jgi:hypothetical protein
MGGEFHQLASAMLVLVFAAVMLVTGLLYIERSGRPFDTAIRASSVLRASDDGFMRARAAMRPSDRLQAQ